MTHQAVANWMGLAVGMMRQRDDASTINIAPTYAAALQQAAKDAWTGESTIVIGLFSQLDSRRPGR